MDKNEILDKMQSIFQDVFDDCDIVLTKATTAQDIDSWDSLNHVSLITSIEEEFSLKFSLNEILNFKSVGDTVDCIHTKINN